MLQSIDRFTRPALRVLAAAACIALAHGQCETWGTEFGGGGFTSTTYALKTFDDGNGPMLWVGGDVVVPGIGGVEVTRWNGQAWVWTGALNDSVTGFGVYNDGSGPSMYAGGYFSLSAGNRGIARWTGSSWVPVGTGLHGGQYVWVNAMASFDAGNGAELYVGGGFTGAGSVFGQPLAKWNGTQWSLVGAGLGPRGTSSPEVFALQAFDDGSGPALYVGGIFGSAGGVPVDGIARWNGVHWSAVGPGADLLLSFAVFDDGTGAALYGLGSFVTGGSIARWNGSSWVALPDTLHLSTHALFAFNDGNGNALYAGGAGYPNPSDPNAVAKWDGHAWIALGSGVNALAWALDALPNAAGSGADLYVGGQFNKAGGVASLGLAKWITCHDAIDSVCPGDHTLALCPCSNHGAPGHGCENSSSSGGALLSASGTSVPDTLVLTSDDELPHVLSIFLQGDAVAPLVEWLGDGLLCAGGNLIRLYAKTAVNGTVQAPQAGDPSISMRSAALGNPIPPGAVRYYQVWYRDPSISYCNGLFYNVSNGARVVW
jgi:hypothetical protein